MIVSYGPFQPSLEEAFVKRIKELLAASARPLCIVTPSRRLADRLERILSVDHSIPLFDVHFHTFYSLAWGIVEDSGFPKGDFISDSAFYNRLIDTLVDQVQKFSPQIDLSSGLKGFSRSLRSSLRDLLDAGVTRERVQDYFEENELAQFLGKESLNFLLYTGELYSQKLSELGVFSVSEIVRSAANNAENSIFLKKFKEIIYYGFYDLTGLQLEFFERVVQSHPCELFFPYRKAHPAFRFAKDFFEQKLGGYESRELNLNSSGLALGRAVDRLFFPTNDSIDPVVSEKLRFVNVSGIDDEVWFAAKEILRLVEKEGFLFEEIGIVARSLDLYRDAASRLLTENAIPFDLKASQPLLRYPLAKTALNLLNIVRRDFPAFLVEDIVASPYFIAGFGSREKWKIQVRRIVKNLGINGGWMQWKGKLGAPIEKESSQNDDLPIKETARLWEIINSWHKSLNSCPDSWAAFGQKVLKILTEFLAIPDEKNNLNAHNDQKDRSRFMEREIWDMFKNALDSLSLFDKLGPPKDFADCLDALEDKLQAASIDVSSGLRGVRVLDAMAARGQSFRALFLLGLNEGSFPRKISEDPFFRDEARSFLRHPAGYWIRPKKEGYEEEKLLFYLMVASAKDQLYCVYSRSNEEGESQVPSLYLQELSRATGVSLSGETNIRVPRGPTEKLATCPAEHLSPAEISLRAILEKKDASHYLQAIESPKAELLQIGLDAVAALNARGEAGARDGFLTQAPQEFLKRWEKKVSASALKTYADCPFSFFAERILGFKEKNYANSKEELDPTITGKIYHDILRRFYSLLPDSFWKKADASYQEFLNSAIDDSLMEYPQRRLGIYPVLWLSMKETMTKHLERFVSWDLGELKKSGLRPKKFEFELAAEFPELANYHIYGILDRVDENPDENLLRVVDYKKRWAPDFRFQGDAGVSKLVSKGDFFQLPFYLELLQKGNPGQNIEGASLFGIEESKEFSGYPTGHSYLFADWKKQRDDFFKRAANLLGSIANGRFPINPSDGEFGHCVHCDFQNLCRKNHAPSRLRAAEALSKNDQPSIKDSE